MVFVLILIWGGMSAPVRIKSSAISCSVSACSTAMIWFSMSSESNRLFWREDDADEDSCRRLVLKTGDELLYDGGICEGSIHIFFISSAKQQTKKRRIKQIPNGMISIMPTDLSIVGRFILYSQWKNYDGVLIFSLGWLAYSDDKCYAIFLLSRLLLCLWYIVDMQLG